MGSLFTYLERFMVIGVVIGLMALGLSVLPINQTAMAEEVEAADKGKKPSVPFHLGRGMNTFQEKCAACHGMWAHGTDKGPPLLHKFYKPSHHADFSFERAMRLGVRAHHWGFGNMPAVEGITEQEIKQVVAFIRWWQQENKVF